jgi:hypothetical protein
VEGHHAAAGNDVTLALGDLEALLARYAGPVSMRRAVLTATASTFD